MFIIRILCACCNKSAVMFFILLKVLRVNVKFSDISVTFERLSSVVRQSIETFEQLPLISNYKAVIFGNQ